MYIRSDLLKEEVYRFVVGNWKSEVLTTTTTNNSTQSSQESCTSDASFRTPTALPTPTQQRNNNITPLPKWRKVTPNNQVDENTKRSYVLEVTRRLKLTRREIAHAADITDFRHMNYWLRGKDLEDYPVKDVGQKLYEWARSTDQRIAVPMTEEEEQLYIAARQQLPTTVPTTTTATAHPVTTTASSISTSTPQATNKRKKQNKSVTILDSSCSPKSPVQQKWKTTKKKVKVIEEVNTEEEEDDDNDEAVVADADEDLEDSQPASILDKQEEREDLIRQHEAAKFLVQQREQQQREVLLHFDEPLRQYQTSPIRMNSLPNTPYRLGNNNHLLISPSSNMTLEDFMSPAPKVLTDDSDWAREFREATGALENAPIQTPSSFGMTSSLPNSLRKGPTFPPTPNTNRPFRNLNFDSSQ